MERSEKYATSVIVGDDGLPESVCSCPYGIDCKHGAAVVSLSRESLAQMGLGEGDDVQVEFDLERVQITITPASAESGLDPQFARQVSEFIEEYRPALRKLASFEEDSSDE